MHHVWGLVSPVKKMTVVLFTECLCQENQTFIARCCRCDQHTCVHCCQASTDQCDVSLRSGFDGIIRPAPSGRVLDEQHPRSPVIIP